MCVEAIVCNISVVLLRHSVDVPCNTINVSALSAAQSTSVSPQHNMRQCSSSSSSSSQQHTGVAVMSEQYVFKTYLNEMLVDPFSEGLLLHGIAVIYSTLHITHQHTVIPAGLLFIARVVPYSRNDFMLHGNRDF